MARSSGIFTLKRLELMVRCGGLRVLSMLIASIAVAACSSSPPVAALDSRALQSQLQPLEADPEYVIGPGDGLRIVVLRNPELGSEVTVRPDGKISSPLVSDMVAVGKTPSQLAKDIEGVLQEFVRAPTVSVIVTHATGAFSQIKIVGQAVSPRAIPYRSGMRVLDAIIEVGGLSQYAAGNRAKVMRTEGGKTKQIRVRLDDLLNRGDVSQDLLLRPGDILVIPEARF